MSGCFRRISKWWWHVRGGMAGAVQQKVQWAYLLWWPNNLAGIWGGRGGRGGPGGTMTATVMYQGRTNTASWINVLAGRRSAFRKPQPLRKVCEYTSQIRCCDGTRMDAQPRAPILTPCFISCKLWNFKRNYNTFGPICRALK